MKKQWVLLATLFLILGTVVLSGCKEGISQSELDKFVARTGSLEGKALEDTLRFFAAGDPPFSTYADYLIGNRFYAAAGDSAKAKGWGDGRVNALLDSAEVYFEKAVAQDSTFIEALVNLGSLWDDRSEQMSSRAERDKRIGKAREYYDLALKVDPTDEKARCNLGSLFLRQRRTEEALNEFKKTLGYNPRSALAHYNIAIMFAESKIYREALREWELAAKYDPKGDIGSRSRANIKIVKDLMNAPTPNAVK